MGHNLTEYLRDEIRALLASKDQSVRWLVKQIGIDYNVVYRLSNGEQKSLSFYQAYKLVKYVNPDGYLSILREYYPNESRDFFPDGNSQEIKNDDCSQKIIAEILSDRFVYEVFLAISCGGSGLKEIESEFGSRGLSAVDFLEVIGALKVSPEGVFDGVLDGFVLFDEELLIKMAETNLALLDMRTPGTVLWNNTSGLNKEGLSTLYQEEHNHWKRVSEIFSDKDLRGSIPVVATSFAGPVLGKERKYKA